MYPHGIHKCSSQHNDAMTPNNILTRKGHKRAPRRLLREKHPTVVTSDKCL